MCVLRVLYKCYSTINLSELKWKNIEIDREGVCETIKKLSNIPVCVHKRKYISYNSRLQLV